MAQLDLQIRAWDEAIREYGFVFEGLKDEDVWKRPHPKLLSVGELTGHVAYYEVVMTTEPALQPEDDLSVLPVQSVLVDRAFLYYPNQLAAPVDLKLGANELLEEFRRVHEEAKAQVTKVDRDSEDLMEGRQNTTWGSYLRYLTFHAAYHAGQAYSVRHLLGHTTTDN